MGQPGFSVSHENTPQFLALLEQHFPFLAKKPNRTNGGRNVTDSKTCPGILLKAVGLKGKARNKRQHTLVTSQPKRPP